MHLAELTVQDFQSYRETESLSFDRGFTLLAGRNDVGKSATLRALRILVENSEGAGDDFEITFRWELALADFMAVVEPRDTLREWLSESEEHSFAATFRRAAVSDPLHPSHVVPVRLDLPALGAVAEGPAGTSLGWRSGRLVDTATHTDTLGRLARDFGSRIVHISPRMVAQGRLAIEPEPQLRPDAQNLPNVLAFLLTNQRLSTSARLEEFIKDAFPQLTGVATVPATRGGSALLPWRERSRSTPAPMWNRDRTHAGARRGGPHGNGASAVPHR